MKLQTADAHLKGRSVTVNGTDYAVDQNLCVDVANPADAKKLQACGWSSDVQTRTRVITPAHMRARPGERAKTTAVRGATEFMQYIAANPDAQESVRQCDTFVELIAEANALGFNFTRDEFLEARRAFKAKLEAKADGARRKKVELVDEATHGADDDTPPERPADDTPPEPETSSTPEATEETPSAETAEPKLLALLPDGTPTDEWPDPEESHEMDYLARMADAYEVVLTEDMDKAATVAAIKDAMYPATAE